MITINKFLCTVIPPLEEKLYFACRIERDRLRHDIISHSSIIFQCSSLANGYTVALCAICTGEASMHISAATKRSETAMSNLDAILHEVSYLSLYLA